MKKIKNILKMDFNRPDLDLMTGKIEKLFCINSLIPNLKLRWS